MALGRISGPLLKANLLREGVNLAFENDLLYLDVTNSRVGINTSTPQYDLDVNGTAGVPNLEVSTQADIGNIRITSNLIDTDQPQLTLGTADTVVYQARAMIDSIDLENNVISTNTSNENLELSPNGTGSVEIFANTNVYGNIVATGSITADGDITIGDADTDNIIINAEVASNIIPDQTETFDLGSPTKKWAEVYTQNLNAENITASTILSDGIDLNLRQGNIIYVAENGDDANSGTHQNDPYGTIKHAISQATTGDTVHIYPGLYEEIFPITVPPGVTVKGHSMRSVNIVPTAGTNTNSAFYLNGEVTIEDLTIKDFFQPGYAFQFDPTGFTVTSRSPYIRNVSVITQGSVTSASDPRGFNQGDAGGGAYLDGELANAASRESGCLFHSVTFIVPGVDGLVFTNGTRVEWLNCFTYFANRGLYAFDSTNGLKGTGQTAIRVDNLDGSFAAGETFTYYDTDGTTVLATGTIDSVDADNKFYITGNLTGLTTAQDRGGKTIVRYQNPVTDTGIKKYGTSSLELDGTEDYIGIAAQNDFGFGTGDFTVEMWVRPDNITGVRALADFRAGSATDTGLYISASAGAPSVYINGSTILSTATTLNVSAWTHVAVARSGSTIKLFLDGVEEDSATYSSTLGVAKPLTVGAVYDGSSGFFDGNIDDVRVKKGSAAYTGAFTPPLSQLVSDSSTVLLLTFNNTADSSVEIIDDVTTSQDLRFSGGATADFVTLADKTDFGGELRSIASANVYGNYGAYGNGNGVLMYLISQNFAYIGVGKESDNDVNDVVQANEVVELNDAQIRFSSVDHNGDFRVGDLFYVNQKDGSINFTSSDFNIDTDSGVTIVNGSDVTTILGSEINTGNFKFSGNTIETLSGDINLSSASGNVVVSSTGALQLPKGTTAERPGTPSTGMIRYNTDTNLFEGYDGNWIALNGVYDLDLDTYITAESSPGADDDTLRFYVAGGERVNITSSRLETPRIEVDDIFVDGNTIGTLTTNTDLNLSANGTGQVNIDNIGFKDSTITNNLADSALLFQQSGNGYFKIEGTGGFVVPSGTSVQRPLPAYRETGMIRFNTQEGYLEVFDGTSWVSVAGESGSITYAAAENLVIEYVLTLG